MGEGIKKIWKHRKLVAFFVIFMVVVLVGVAVYIRFFVYNDKAKVTTEYINGMLSKSSELTTAKLNYTGMTEYSDEGISVINKGDFVMVYRATVRAGINVDEIKSKVDDKNEIIYLTIPKATIQEVKIDPNSIKYFDEKLTLFNTNEKEDANKSQAQAEEAAIQEAAKMGILEMADEQSEALIKGILKDSIPDSYKIIVKKQ